MDAISPEAVRQIVDAIQQTDAWQFLESLMAEGHPDKTSDDNTPTEGELEQQAHDGPVENYDDEQMTGGDADDDADFVPDVGDEVEEDMDAGGGGGPEESAGDDAGGGDGGYPDDEEEEEYAGRRRYEGDAAGEYSTDQRPQMPPAPHGDADEDFGAPSEGSVQDRYARDRNRDRERYRRLHSDHRQLVADHSSLAEKYTKLQKQHSHLARRVVDTERRSELERLYLNGYTSIDPDKEMEKCCYGKMSDEQFAERLEFIESHVTPAPVGGRLPAMDHHNDDGILPSEPISRNGHARESYNKKASDRALAICQEKVMAGEEVDYASTLADLKAGRIK